MRKRTKASGFTMVEIVFALGLMMVLLLGLFALSTSSAQMRTFTRDRDIAREEARAKLEEIMCTNFGGIEAAYFPGGNPSYFPVPGLKWDVPGEQPGRVTIDTTTAPASAGPQGLKKVIVEVRWVGDAGNNRFELTSYVADRDPN